MVITFCELLHNSYILNAFTKFKHCYNELNCHFGLLFILMVNSC